MKLKAFLEVFVLKKQSIAGHDTEIEKDINQGKEGSQMKAAKEFASMQGISVTEAYKSLGFSKNKK